MKHFAKLATCLAATLCTVLASAQASTQDGVAVKSTSSTSAFVYVITNPTSNSSELDGYSAASNGALTPLPGSPFWTSNQVFVNGLANTAHWLFLSDGTYIYSFSISSTGTLKQVSSINAFQYYGEPGGEAGAYLVLDHTGSTLYALAQDGSGDNEILFFEKNSTTGALTYLGNTGLDISYGYLAFSANNEYAYNFACYGGAGGSDLGGIRSSDGTLTGFTPTYPDPTYSGGSYCLNAVAADPFGNLAVAMYPTPFSTGAPGLPPALGVYTIDSSGNLSTNSTAENMPTTEVGWMNQNNLDMAASPAGNLLAVSGSSGLQIFFFNGSKQITPYTGFLAEHPITQIEWDNSNHLYGISSSGRLYSFTVTTTGNHQDPGSPYTVNSPRSITVLSK